MGGIGRGQVVSFSGGRLRVRVPRGAQAHSELIALSQRLESLPQVSAVEIRPRSASVIVSFDPQQTAMVEAQLRELGMTSPRREESARSDPAAKIREVASALNHAVTARVPAADLRLLLPLSLGLLSVRQLARGDDRLSEAPWYVLAMYAAASFSRIEQSGKTVPSRSSSGER